MGPTFLPTPLSPAFAPAAHPDGLCRAALAPASGPVRRGGIHHGDGTFRLAVPRSKFVSSFHLVLNRTKPFISITVDSFLDLATDQIATSAVRHHLGPKASERRVFRGRANPAAYIDPLNFSVPFQSFELVQSGLVSRFDKWMLRPDSESWQEKNAKLIHNFHFGSGQRWISPSLGAVTRAFQPIIDPAVPAASAAMHSA